jgi:hypothetical protein
MFSLWGKMKSIGGRSKVKEVSEDKGRLSNFIEVSRGKVLLLVRTAVLTPLPPRGDESSIGCPSLTNETQSGERLLRHRGMEGLPTFRHSN